jgi:hypothetical protein
MCVFLSSKQNNRTVALSRERFVGVGAILIAPLVKHYNTRSVLAVAVFGFGLVTAILLICDGMLTLSTRSSLSQALAQRQLEGVFEQTASITMEPMTLTSSSREQSSLYDLKGL